MLTAWQGAAGNLGMYAMGIPMGLLTDARGPRLITLVGSILLALGYYPIYLGMQIWDDHIGSRMFLLTSIAYQSGEGSVPIIFLCFFAFLTGTGGCSAFGGAIKTGEYAHNLLEKELKLTFISCSCFQLPRSPRYSNCISVGCLWTECPVLV
jgi:hypothetical protein